MNKIFFARHGESQANLDNMPAFPDSPLTELGKRQAGELAEKIRDLSIKKIIYSPYFRAQETAEIIAEKLVISDTEELEELSERNFGILRGKPKIQRSAFYYGAAIDNEKGVESVDALILRMQSCLKSLTDLAERVDGNTLVVGHAVSGYCLQQVALGNRNELQFIGLAELNNADFVEINFVGTP